MIRLGLVIAGCLVLLAALWFRAVKKMTVDLTAMWGILGIMLVLSGAIAPLSDWISECFSGMGPAMAVLGFICLLTGFQFSLVLSHQMARNQDLAIEVSLLKRENERILDELEMLMKKAEKQS